MELPADWSKHAARYLVPSDRLVCFPVACDQLVETVSGWLYAQPATCDGWALFGGVSQTAGIGRRQGRLFQCIGVMRVAVAGRRGGAHDLA